MSPRQVLPPLRSAVAIVFVLLFLAATEASASPSDVKPSSISIDAKWLIRLPTEEKLLFRGMLPAEGISSNSRSGLLYGPGLAGFFIMIAAHAAIEGGVQAIKKSKAQTEADSVLMPYLTRLDKMSVSDALRPALDRTRLGGAKQLISAVDQKTLGAWLMETTPVFTMTQDERALVLDNAIIVYSPESPTAAIYKSVVRVVSHPNPTSDEQSPQLALWTAGDRPLIQSTVVDLLAESIDLVINELSNGSAPTAYTEQKTFRFSEGGEMKAERATLIEERCDRVVIRNLRGWLMSVPFKSNSVAPPPCDPPLQTQKQ
jgi:hypothetical protein